MQVDPAELSLYVLYQLGALAGIASVAGHRVTHMSFHGALGNTAAADYALAKPLVQAVAAFDRNLIVSVSTNTQIEAPRANSVSGWRRPSSPTGHIPTKATSFRANCPAR